MGEPQPSTDVTTLPSDQLLDAVKDADAHYWLAFASGQGMDVLGPLETARRLAWDELERRLR